MDTAVEICNLALSHIGQGVTIASLSERTAAAQACNDFFETARKKFLRDYKPAFALKRNYSFAEVEEFEDEDNSEWGFSYRWPSDCLAVIKLHSGIRQRSPDTDVPFEQGGDSTEKLILTDEEDAVGDYVLDHDNFTIWHEDSMIALSYLVAHYIAPRLSKGNIIQMKRELWQFYLAEANNAVGNIKNEQTYDEAADPEMIRARQ